MALDLSIELHAFLLELESHFLELLVSGFQLLYPQKRWGPCIPLNLISKSFVEVASPSWMLSMCPSGVRAMKHS